MYFNSSLHWFHAKSFASLSVNWVTAEMFFCMKCSLVWTEALITSTLCHSSRSQLVLLLGFSQLLMEMCIIEQRGFCGEKKNGEKMGKGAGLEGQGGHRGWTIKGRLPEETDSNSDQKLLQVFHYRKQPAHRLSQSPRTWPWCWPVDVFYPNTEKTTTKRVSLNSCQEVEILY